MIKRYDDYDKNVNNVVQKRLRLKAQSVCGKFWRCASKDDNDTLQQNYGMYKEH